jgi:ferritin
MNDAAINYLMKQYLEKNHLSLVDVKDIVHVLKTADENTRGVVIRMMFRN